MDPQLFELYSDGALPPASLITTQNNKKLLTKGTVNILLKILYPNRLITNNDQRRVVDFLKAISIENYIGKSYKVALELIARDFIRYLKSNEVDYDTYETYKQKEIHHLTKDESGLKYGVYPTLHDSYQEIEKKSQRQESLSSKDVTQADVNRTMVRMANMVIDMCSPQSRAEMYEKMRSFNVTYQSTIIPRQTLCFDSRNRNDATSTLTSISWDLNYTKGKSSSTGNVSVQRPIQHIIRVNIDNPFWLWVVQQNFYLTTDKKKNDITAISPSDFFRLTMNIEEFNAQAVTIELPRGQNQLQYSYYTFSLNVTQIKSITTNRVYVGAYTPFTFMKPLAQLDSITMRFYNDYNPIYILPDYFQYSNISKTTSITGTQIVEIGGMVGKTAVIYEQILKTLIKDFKGNIVYPADIVTTYNLNTDFFATPAHITYVDMVTPEISRLLCDIAGWQTMLDFTGMVNHKLIGYSQNDKLRIDVTNTPIASLPDFSQTRTDPPLVGLYLDALSFTINLEFISLEMPAY